MINMLENHGSNIYVKTKTYFGEDSQEVKLLTYLVKTFPEHSLIQFNKETKEYIINDDMLLLLTTLATLFGSNKRVIADLEKAYDLHEILKEENKQNDNLHEIIKEENKQNDNLLLLLANELNFDYTKGSTKTDIIDDLKSKSLFIKHYQQIVRNKGTIRAIEALLTIFKRYTEEQGNEFEYEHIESKIEKMVDIKIEGNAGDFLDYTKEETREAIDGEPYPAIRQDHFLYKIIMDLKPAGITYNLVMNFIIEVLKSQDVVIANTQNTQPKPNQSIEEIIRLTYKADGGTFTKNGQDTIIEERVGFNTRASAESKDFYEREGYHFLGWDSDLTDIVDTDTVYTAEWQKLRKLSIEFYNGETKIESYGQELYADSDNEVKLSDFVWPPQLVRGYYRIWYHNDVGSKGTLELSRDGNNFTNFVDNIVENIFTDTEYIFDNTQKIYVTEDGDWLSDLDTNSLDAIYTDIKRITYRARDVGFYLIDNQDVIKGYIHAHSGFYLYTDYTEGGTAVEKYYTGWKEKGSNEEINSSDIRSITEEDAVLRIETVYSTVKKLSSPRIMYTNANHGSLRSTSLTYQIGIKNENDTAVTYRVYHGGSHVATDIVQKNSTVQAEIEIASLERTIETFVVYFEKTDYEQSRYVHIAPRNFVLTGQPLMPEVIIQHRALNISNLSSEFRPDNYDKSLYSVTRAKIGNTDLADGWGKQYTYSYTIGSAQKSSAGKSFWLHHYSDNIPEITLHIAENGIEKSSTSLANGIDYNVYIYMNNAKSEPTYGSYRHATYSKSGRWAELVYRPSEPVIFLVRVTYKSKAFIAPYQGEVVKIGYAEPYLSGAGDFKVSIDHSNLSKDGNVPSEYIYDLYILPLNTSDYTKTIRKEITAGQTTAN